MGDWNSHLSVGQSAADARPKAVVSLVYLSLSTRL